jgi:putative two-component system response regulator
VWRDALTTARPYKEPWTIERTVDHILDRAGSQFDPSCVAAFKLAMPDIIRIMRENGQAQDPVVEFAAAV